MRVDLPVPFAPTSAVRSLLRISQLASRKRIRGPKRLPAFWRESICFIFALPAPPAVGRRLATHFGFCGCCSDCKGAFVVNGPSVAPSIFCFFPVRESHGIYCERP